MLSLCVMVASFWMVFLEYKTELFWFLSVTKGTDVVFNMIAYDVFGSKDELTGVLSEKCRVGIDYIYRFIQFLFP